jgi:hypothetical protein
MHSKRKGNVGQFAVGLELTKLGYSVFTEEGDISKIDIIGEKQGKLIRIQVKAITPVNGSLICKMVKAGPNYRFSYTKDMFDYFAVYDLSDSSVYLIDSTILDKNGNCLTLRKTKSKNNQKQKINMAEDYEISRVLGG